jgi:hypothetical protein
MRLARTTPLLLVAASVLGCSMLTRPASAPPSATRRQFTFAWPFREGDAVAPRGGTTQGGPVELAADPSPAWTRLRDETLPARERDRLAILAMAGTFRASFDFLEVVGFRPGFVPDRPYQSWGTEYVHVLADEPRFVSLQHVLVMFVETKEGKLEGPMVVKHWRQDWRYESRERLVYRGRNTWAKERISADQARGTWTQSVYQVDDSPRYAAHGRWEHLGNVSTWIGSRTWRPLPRREFSVRKDYEVLVGTNRHTITPTGWVQEEENLKIVLAGPGRPVAAEPVLSKEVGLNRYERLAGFDDSAARRYAERTGPFWREVRAAWAEIIAANRSFTLRGAPDQSQLFMPLFEYAERLDEGAPLDAAEARRFARETVRGYLAEPGSESSRPTY